MSRPSTLTPDWSPWGSIQESEELGADGILRVRTATGRGYFIPRQANARIHETWRVRTGWYGQGERDDHWAIVAITFPDLFPRTTVQDAHALQRQARPSQYEAAVTATDSAEGQDLPAPAQPQAPAAIVTTATPGSVVAVRRTPTGPRKAGPIATQVWGEWHESVPTGFVGVSAAPDSDPSHITWHLIPVAEYDNRPGFRFTVDPERHPLWTDHP